MKISVKAIAVLLILSFCFGELDAQTFTMGKKCREKAAQANELLAQDSYADALGAFDAMAGDCKTKDGKEVVNVGRAEALNGLGRYDEAIEACDAALKVTKNRSLMAHFQKAVAYNKTGDTEKAKSSLDQVIQLTEMNQNTAERAKNYALMAAVYDRQLHDTDSAMLYLEQAITLDSGNPSFYIQRGDMYLHKGEHSAAQEQYDMAIEKGMDPLEGYIIKSEADLKMLENKYGTSKAQDLRSKMNDAEKAQVCGNLTKALELGWVDMNKDMFAALVCK